MEGDTIVIKKLVNDIKVIETDNKKEDFICDYNKLKENISLVDNALKKEDKKEDKKIKNKSINELYEMLEQMNAESDENINAEQLRKMKIVLDTIENKIQQVDTKIEKIN